MPHTQKKKTSGQPSTKITVQRLKECYRIAKTEIFPLCNVKKKKPKKDLKVVFNSLSSPNSTYWNCQLALKGILTEIYRQIITDFIIRQKLE